jgi:hypothetical protein
MGTPRARWCAPARSPPWFYGRACKTLLKGVSVARLTLWKPPAPITSRTRASPACAGRRTDLLRQRGRHADHHRTRVIKVGRPGSNCLRGGRPPSARRPSTRRPALAILIYRAIYILTQLAAPGVRRGINPPARPGDYRRGHQRYRHQISRGRQRRIPENSAARLPEQNFQGYAGK